MNPNNDTMVYWIMPTIIDGRGLVFSAVRPAASFAGFSKK